MKDDKAGKTKDNLKKLLRQADEYEAASSGDLSIAAVTATFSNGSLSSIGDGLANNVAISRDAAGKLLINGGAMPVSGVAPTVANTSLVQVFGLGGHDVIALDETSGALPRAHLFGGAGNDSLTGGSGGDLLFGQSGTDVLFGQGGNDSLFGGSEDDILTGGDGDDQIFAEDGNDRMIWNPGDDDDLIEGGSGVDTAEVNGNQGAEVFTVSAASGRVTVDRLIPAPFELDIGTTEKLVVNMNGGDDSFSATGNLASLISVTVDGGAGNDSILGSNGNDTLIGGEGNDFIDGQQGNDVALLSAGNDVFQWDPGDGSDVIEGQDGQDLMLFNGSAGDEAFELTTNGGRALFARNLGDITMDLNEVETVTLNALGGADTLTVGDLSGTDVSTVNVNLAGMLSGTAGDGMTDTVTVEGSGLADSVDVLGSSAGLFVLGSPATVAVTNVEAGNDILIVEGGAGDDRISGASMNAGLVRLTLHGEAGDDQLSGSRGADLLNGGEGNDFVDGEAGDDVALLGEGNDIFRWEAGDGNDVIEGQAGRDVALIHGSAAGETTTIAANGGRVLTSRNSGTELVDLNGVEKLDILAQGGADSLVIGDLAGTDLIEIAINLGAVVGSPKTDGAADSVTAHGDQAADVAVISGKAGSATVSVAGLAAGLTLTRAEAALDRLTVDAGAGDDVIDATGLDAGVIGLVLNGGAGADVIVGSQGNDLIRGGDGADVAVMGAGDDIFEWNKNDDNDVVEGQDGFDTLRLNSVGGFIENFELSANGGRTLLALSAREDEDALIDLGGIERVEINAFGLLDEVTVDDLSETGIQEVQISFAPAGGAGDNAGDIVGINATSDADAVELVGGPGNLSVAGLEYGITITGAEPNVDFIDIDLGGGNDMFSAATLAAGALEVLGINSGEGDDTIIGSQGEDVILAGEGDDVVTGGKGNDRAILEEGDDTFVWNPGDGNDVVEAGEGIDQLFFSGASASETINLSTHIFTRLLLTRDVANVTVDANFVEDVVLQALGGQDNIVVGDLAATDVKTIEIDLQGGSGVGDGEADIVTATGTAGSDAIGVTGDAGGVRVFGLSAQIDIFHQEVARDRLVLNAGAGDDVVNASSLQADRIQLTIDGGLGKDTMLGSEGYDRISGGDGDDVAVMGAGDDTFVWNPGDDNDVVEGQAGFDTMLFNGANVAETINVAVNDGRVLFTRNIANVSMDLDEVESIDFNALGGADIVNIGDLSGTDLAEINISLGGADGAQDIIVIDGTNGDDVVLVIGDNGQASIKGLAATINLSGFEASSDRVVVRAFTGDDVIEASDLDLASIGLTLDGGVGDDILLGGEGNDILLGGEGNDVLIGGGGIDIFDGGPGEDIDIQGIFNPFDALPLQPDLMII